MNAFQKLWERRISEVYDAYFASAREAEAARPREYEACVRIQAFYRGYASRKLLHKERDAAKNIQRVFRGYMARLEYEQRLKAKEKRERMAFFDRNATVIQKMWRGYYSRKNIHSYYRRKAYIMGVVQKGEELLVRRKQHQEVLEEELKQEKSAIVEAKFKEEAARNHHMVSTKAIHGVFYSTKVAGTSDLEYYIRANRNTKSPPKSRPVTHDVQSTLTLPVIPIQKADTPPTKHSRPLHSLVKVPPLPALTASLSPTKRKAVL